MQKKKTHVITLEVPEGTAVRVDEYLKELEETPFKTSAHDLFIKFISEGLLRNEARA
tara:strand:- start:502 stop:672 length:171 start_codon:yes stop_codon:yes gene_type:complete